MIAYPPNEAKRTTQQIQMAFCRLPACRSHDSLLIGDMPIVESWEEDLQHSLVSGVVAPGDRVVEIGYGLGFASTQILALNPAEYLILEAHPFVYDLARQRLGENSNTIIVQDFWQNVCPPEIHNRFQALIYDPYPVCANQPFDGSLAMTFDLFLEFVPHARRWVLPGGRWGFLDFSCEIADNPRFRRIVGESDFAVSVYSEQLPVVHASYARESHTHIVVLTV
jgi:hypothetical protein